MYSDPKRLGRGGGTTPLTLLPTSRLPSIPVMTSDPRMHRISAQRLRPGVLYCDLLNFWHPPVKKWNSLSPWNKWPLSPCPTKVCEYVDPTQPFISASFYYTASCLLPRQHVTERGMVEGGRCGGGEVRKRRKAKESQKRKRAREAERGGGKKR